MGDKTVLKVVHLKGVLSLVTAFPFKISFQSPIKKSSPQEFSRGVLKGLGMMRNMWGTGYKDIQKSSRPHISTWRRLQELNQRKKKKKIKKVKERMNRRKKRNRNW